MMRKAKITDAKAIYLLIRVWARKGKVLERSLNYTYENIRDFWVYIEDKKMVGCCALRIIGWETLGEIKSLVVRENFQRHNVGRKLVEACIQEAKSLGIKNIFALTFVAGFFKRLGFKAIDKKKLPHKIWNDCINCVDFPDCHEEAVMFNLNGPL
ncbi:MAG: N-acetyltransferase [Omnitrophica bacterium]|nr:N-acetyltransferase [Candidatus Omnitrophota bacterium]